MSPWEETSAIWSCARSLFAPFGVSMPKRERFRTGDLSFCRVLLSHKLGSYASEFLLVNSFSSFALVWCETLSYGVRHMLPWLSVYCPYVCEFMLVLSYWFPCLSVSYCCKDCLVYKI